MFFCCLLPISELAKRVFSVADTTINEHKKELP